MSDGLLSESELAEIKARDRRYVVIEIGAAMAHELRESQSVRTFLAAMRNDAEEALFEFGKINLADQGQVVALQVRVRSYAFLKETIDRVMQSAGIAESQILAEADAGSY